MRRGPPSPVRSRIVIEAVAGTEIRIAWRRRSGFRGFAPEQVPKPDSSSFVGPTPDRSQLLPLESAGEEGDPMAAQPERDASTTGLKVPFGERDGVFYPPTAVDGGLPCACHCPGCGRQLL